MLPPFDYHNQISAEERILYAQQVASLFADIGRCYSASGSVSDVKIYGPRGVGAMLGLEECVQAYYFLQHRGQSDEVVSLSARLDACEAATFRVTGELMSRELLLKKLGQDHDNAGASIGHIDPVLRVLPSFAPPGLLTLYDARAIKADLAKDVPLLK